MRTDTCRRSILLALSSLVAFPTLRPSLAREAPKTATLMTLDKAAVFKVTSNGGNLKETVQEGQILSWKQKEPPGQTVLEMTDISVGLLHSETGGGVKITFSCSFRTHGYRTLSDLKLNVVCRSKGGAALYAWNFGVTLRCGENKQTLAPRAYDIPSDVAANVFAHVDAVEIAQYTSADIADAKIQICE
jgi:hypothetical protein